MAHETKRLFCRHVPFFSHATFFRSAAVEAVRGGAHGTRWRPWRALSPLLLFLDYGAIPDQRAQIWKTEKLTLKNIQINK